MTNVAVSTLYRSTATILMEKRRKALAILVDARKKKWLFTICNFRSFKHNCRVFTNEAGTRQRSSRSSPLNTLSSASLYSSESTVRSPRSSISSSSRYANGAGYGDCGGIIRKAWEYRSWEGSYANGAGYGDCGGGIRKAWEYPSREGSSLREDGICSSEFFRTFQLSLLHVSGNA